MKIDYVENGDHFVRNDGWAKDVYNEITEECYEVLCQMTYGEVSKIIEDNLSDAEKWGYGFYGHDLWEKDGKYYLGKKIGSSCD